VNCWLAPCPTDAEVGLKEIEVRVAVAPVPLRVTCCGLLVALSVKLRVPDRAPVVVGLNLMEAVQLLFAANFFGLIGQADVTVKSLRLLATLEMVTPVVRLLVSVTVCAALEVPTFWLPNKSAEGLAATGRTPVPVRLTVGTAVELLSTVKVVSKLPVTDGLNETEIVQLALAASCRGLMGQVVLSA